MVLWIFFCIFGSVVFILVLHQIYLFFRDTLTTPKVKDFISIPEEKYKHIYETIHSPPCYTHSPVSSACAVPGEYPAMAAGDDSQPLNYFVQNQPDEIVGVGGGGGGHDMTSRMNPMDMKNELKHFLKDMI